MHLTKNFYFKQKHEITYWKDKKADEPFDEQTDALWGQLFTSYLFFKKPKHTFMTKYGTILNHLQIFEGTNCFGCRKRANIITR